MKNKLFYAITLGATLMAAPGCQKYLDVNSDPDTPQQPNPASVMPAMLAGIPRGIQYDARYIGRYIQNFNLNTAADVWDQQGALTYASASDVGGDVWRQCYFGLGANLDYMIKQGITNGQWDYVGAAYALKAYEFQQCTDIYGEIIFTEAFAENKSLFHFDDQLTVYRGVDSICRLALAYLARTDWPASAIRLSKGDYTYNGDVSKWTKFVNGLLARNFMRWSNKPDFKPDSVVYYASRAMASFNDDFLVPFDATRNDDANFFGTYRNNMASFRQSKMIVDLLDGTGLAGSQTYANRDPRIRHMLSASQDTTNGNGGYRSVLPGAGDPQNGTASRARVAVLWGDSLYANPSSSAFDPTKGKYLFKDNVVLPVMTYSEMQFLIAEAYFRKNDQHNAYLAYINGINGHFDFINRPSFPRSNKTLFNVTFGQISSAERAAYLASANVKSEANMKLSDIMQQKYIAQWGWNYAEQWVDLRRYHYTDSYNGSPVFPTFNVPNPIAAINNGKMSARIRPRYNSEYVWNRTELDALGASQSDYQTKPMWFQ